MGPIYSAYNTLSRAICRTAGGGLEANFSTYFYALSDLPHGVWEVVDIKAIIPYFKRLTYVDRKG